MLFVDFLERSDSYCVAELLKLAFFSLFSFCCVHLTIITQSFRSSAHLDPLTSSQTRTTTDCYVSLVPYFIIGIYIGQVAVVMFIHSQSSLF